MTRGGSGLAPVEAVVWDFDGTLANRPDMWCAAIAEAVHRCGGPASVTAADFEETAYLHLPWHSPTLGHAFRSSSAAWWEGFLFRVEPLVTAVTGGCAMDVAYFGATVRSIVLDPRRYARIPGSTRAVDALHRRGVPQFVLSNHVPELAGIVSYLFPGRFAEVWTSGRLGVEKPRAEAFRHALDRIGRAPATVLMVGDDATRDLEPAARLGMRTLHVKDMASTGRGDWL
ncbi:HAD family hydrolase [Streptomyces sp. NBC_01455]|uniref:HAD family hydrolase n=1 Tax=Streptomyces sp. NBC_01455 TaxID=2903874 RepID=UPI002E322931|nr:HAD-IA family hydrolase [Streptomyces sp. NBC_01455]